jgi:diguanylate cyclase (GGDEF)-like protein
MERIAEANRRLALTDPLTGLPNRRHLERYLDRVLARRVLAGSRQTSSRLRPFSLALFDVDDFKRFNDRLGYVAGDEVLSILGRTLSRACPTPTARLGGDEFVAVLPGKAVDEAREAARHMAKVVARDPALSVYGVTVSFGVAALDAGMNHWQDLLAVADLDFRRRRLARPPAPGELRPSVSWGAPARLPPAFPLHAGYGLPARARRPP